MEREGGICFKQNWFLPHSFSYRFHAHSYNPHALKLWEMCAREVIWPGSVVCTWRTRDVTHQVLTMSPDLCICDALFLGWIFSILWQSATLLWCVLSLLNLGYLSLGESQFAACFLGFPAVSVFMATVSFPVARTGRGTARIASCNLAAVLLLSQRRSSANPCCGIRKA